ncbi:polysaccharide pyruvyl transferase family protein [Ruania zhangjianzhongii]|uniref:polysaccharide pyruvyl transferase family protein n=1 Tax=Ruania zhangjianzhongii TaxID=2603206 RepID=UPI00143DEC8C|nr:polysaccharide pyruvyl transferase family protein [Ruania zhangjianzhongii]
MRQLLPQVSIVRGKLTSSGHFTTPELEEAWRSAEVMVHGSAADVENRHAEFQHWSRTTGKPHGYAGVTVDPVCPPTWGTLAELQAMAEFLPSSFHSEEAREPLNSAEFIFCRDSISLNYLRRQQIKAASLEFGPDGTFSYGDADLATIDPFLKEMDLSSDSFACFVPRLRYAPYAQMRGEEPTSESLRRDAINAATSQADLGPLVAAIVTWVRQTQSPAAVVPEMSYAPAYAREHLLPLLPPDVAPQVRVLDRFWSLAEASAVYSVSRAVISMECHSPIIASAHAVPTVYLRQPTETVKGRMYHDLGGSDMLIEISLGAKRAAAETVTSIIDDPQRWSDTSARVNAVARSRLRQMASTILYGESVAPYEPALACDQLEVHDEECQFATASEAAAPHRRSPSDGLSSTAASGRVWPGGQPVPGQ